MDSEYDKLAASMADRPFFPAEGGRRARTHGIRLLERDAVGSYAITTSPGTDSRAFAEIDERYAISEMALSCADGDSAQRCGPAGGRSG